MESPTIPDFRLRITTYAKVARTFLHHLLRRTDTKKWNQFDFPLEWDQRSRQIATLIPPGSTVYEFGAGKSKLGEFLPQNCTLIESDVIERRPGMLIIDLNCRPFPSISGCAPCVAVFGGVFEYLSDSSSVVQWAGQNFDLCVVSYECAGEEPGWIEWLRLRIRRIHEGWVNHYTEIQLSALFAKAGFRLVRTAVWGQTDPGSIYVFQRVLPSTNECNNRIGPDQPAGTANA
jgi:hypothetical protein